MPVGCKQEGYERTPSECWHSAGVPLWAFLCFTAELYEFSWPSMKFPYGLPMTAYGPSLAVYVDAYELRPRNLPCIF